MERGDLTEFVKKKRITDHDFPPPLYVGGKFKKNASQIMIFLPHYMCAENNFKKRITDQDFPPPLYVAGN